MKFQVRSIYLGDKAVTDVVLTSTDEASLRSMLSEQRQTILSVREIKEKQCISDLFKAKKKESYPLFCRELRTLTQAGMSVVEAVDTLASREQLANNEGTLSQLLLVQLQQGKSLSGALSELPQSPSVLIAAIRAGERTSNLSEALNDYLRFDGLVEQLKRKAINASIYPALVTSLGFAISVFLLVVVMPNFANMYQNLRGGLSGTTMIIIALSGFLKNHQLEVILLVILFVTWMIWWIASGRALKFCLGLATLVPYIKHRVVDFYLSMMYQTLALLLKGGYPMTEAMKVACQSALSPEIKSSLNQSLIKIEQGALVSQTLADFALCDEVGRRLMAAAERNGAFFVAADVVSNMHREKFELFVERMTRIIEPVLLVLVAMLVGTIVVMMYLPIFDMTTRVR